MISAHLFIILTIFIFSIQLCASCDINEIRFGCRIHGKVCVCGNGCPDKTYYQSRAKCLVALKAFSTEICSKSPCKNNGECLTVTQEPGFKCLCAGTGFYGDRCDRPCSGSDVAEGESGHFPYECVII